MPCRIVYISGDRHLLQLKIFRKTCIVTLREFFDIIPVKGTQDDL